jgi:hypothetical protein
MKKNLLTCLFVLALLHLSLSLPAAAAPPKHLADLMNTAEEWAKNQMNMRGYSVVRSQYNDVYWSNRTTRSCVVITINRGRVIEISELSRQQCEVDGSATQLPGSPGLSSASPAKMTSMCRNRVNKLFRADLSKKDTKYEGQRTDGTHAVNGSTRISGERIRFQCNFNSNGSMTNIIVEQ